MARGPVRHLFVFGGRTACWPEMGRELYAREPVFRETVQECERIIAGTPGGPSLRHHFEGDPACVLEESHLLYINAVVQLASLHLWRANRVWPDAVLGISLGEVAAVYAAGGLTLADALRVIACYSSIRQVAPPDCGVLLVCTGFAALSALAVNCPVGLFIILVRDDHSCLAYCAPSDFPAAKTYLAANGVDSQTVSTEPLSPFHTRRLERHTAFLRLPLRELEPLPVALPCYLATTGRVIAPGTVLGADYWLTLAYHPVQMHSTLEAVRADRYQTLTPVGANPFPFYSRVTQKNRFKGVQLQAFMHPRASEWDVFAGNRKELATLGLMPSTRPAPPAVSPAKFTRELQLLAPDVVADPHASFAFLRRHGGVHFLPSWNAWLVLEADLIDQVLGQPQVFSSQSPDNFDAELIGADPPVHTLNRAMFQSFFSPREMAGLGEYMAAYLQELAIGLRGLPSFDFVSELAMPLSQAVGGRLLGLSPADQDKIRRSLPGHPYDLRYFDEAGQFFTDHLQHRSVATGPFTILDALRARVTDGEVTLPAAVSMSRTLWLAGIATTSILMSSAANYLLGHPAVFDQLRTKPERIGAFIEELLRLEPPVPTFGRRTTGSVNLGGQEIPTGAAVVCCVAAANRNPAHYGNPDEMDLDRRPIRHQSFGGGIHACMGAHLARLEARVMVQWLLVQGSDLRFANPFTLPEYHPTTTFRALSRLPLILRDSADAI